MAIKRKDFDEIRKKMGGKSAKEFVRASERSDAKTKALEKKKDEYERREGKTNKSRFYGSGVGGMDI